MRLVLQNNVSQAWHVREPTPACTTRLKAWCWCNMMLGGIRAHRKCLDIRGREDAYVCVCVYIYIYIHMSIHSYLIILVIYEATASAVLLLYIAKTADAWQSRMDCIIWNVRPKRVNELPRFVRLFASRSCPELWNGTLEIHPLSTTLCWTICWPILAKVSVASVLIIWQSDSNDWCIMPRNDPRVQECREDLGCELRLGGCHVHHKGIWCNQSQCCLLGEKSVTWMEKRCNMNGAHTWVTSAMWQHVWPPGLCTFWGLLFSSRIGFSRRPLAPSTRCSVNLRVTTPCKTAKIFREHLWTLWLLFEEFNCPDCPNISSSFEQLNEAWLAVDLAGWVESAACEMAKRCKKGAKMVSKEIDVEKPQRNNLSPFFLRLCVYSGIGMKSDNCPACAEIFAANVHGFQPASFPRVLEWDCLDVR